MPRARHPLPFEIWGIRPDLTTGRYILSEQGATFYLTLEHTRLLKEYYRRNTIGVPSIEDWLKKLDKSTRKEIIVKGLKEASERDFYPDVFYE